MKAQPKKPKREKITTKGERLNLPEMTSAQAVVLCLAKVARLRSAGRVDSRFVEDFCRIGGVITKALTLIEAGEASDEYKRALAALGTALVQNPGEGVGTSAGESLQDESEEIPDGARGPEELQDGDSQASSDRIGTAK